MELYSQHPFQVVTHHIGKVATKLLLEQANNLQSVIQTMTVLLVGLYQIHDLPFFAQVMRMFVQCFRKSVEENKLSDCPPFQGYCLGQLSNVISYLYIYDAVGIDFVFSFVEYLLANLCPATLDTLLKLLQNTGMKVRSDNPGKLKSLISDVTERFQTDDSQEKSRNNQFILDLLNDIKLNKYKNDLKEKLAFLISFLQKRVVQKYKVVQKCFPADFMHCFSSDFSKKQWYQTIQVGVDSVAFE